MSSNIDIRPRSIAVFRRYSEFVGIEPKRFGGGTKLVIPSFIVSPDMDRDREAWERLSEWFFINETDLTDIGSTVKRHTTLKLVELADVISLAFAESIPELGCTLLNKFNLTRPLTKNPPGN